MFYINGGFLTKLNLFSSSFFQIHKKLKNFQTFPKFSGRYFNEIKKISKMFIFIS